jgi:5-hydroxyisourate hydrolase-like protein (transthyretin family)
MGKAISEQTKSNNAPFNSRSMSPAQKVDPKLKKGKEDEKKVETKKTNTTGGVNPLNKRNTFILGKNKYLGSK